MNIGNVCVTDSECVVVMEAMYFEKCGYFCKLLYVNCLKIELHFSRSHKEVKNAARSVMC